MARDRTARNRIRQHLAAHGPVIEHSGHATGALQEAIGYEGTPVAFIQLIAAMDRDGEIVRDIKGKRTYGISLSEKSIATAQPFAPSGRETVELDYEKLARAIVREFVRVLDLPLTIDRREAEPIAPVAGADGYAKRLERAREEIDLLLRTVSQDETVSAGS